MKLNVEHYLRIYSTRLQMQEEGLTNPSGQTKKFTRELVDMLKNLPLKEVIAIDNY